MYAAAIKKKRAKLILKDQTIERGRRARSSLKKIRKSWLVKQQKLEKF